MTFSTRIERIILAVLSLMLVPCWILGGPREALDADLAEAAGIRLLIGGWAISWLLGAAVVLLRRSAPLQIWSRSTILAAMGSIAGNTIWFHVVGPQYPTRGSEPWVDLTRLLVDLALVYSAIAVPTLALYWKVTPDRTGSRPASDRGVE